MEANHGPSFFTLGADKVSSTSTFMKSDTKSPVWKNISLEESFGDFWYLELLRATLFRPESPRRCGGIHQRCGPRRNRKRHREQGNPSL